jgi:exonuclease VII small subunit
VAGKTIEEAQDAYKAARRELIAAVAGVNAVQDALEDARIRWTRAQKVVDQTKLELDASIDSHADQLALDLSASGAV